MKLTLPKILFVLIIFSQSYFAQAIIIDHNCTNIKAIPESAILKAKQNLHIAYGHTSHGSQITTGMNGLVEFANNGGLGLTLKKDIFKWNNGGSNEALDLEEGDGYGSGWLDHDCGYYPNWVNETREYLNDSSHSDVNVIIWSWCGQVSGRSEQDMIDKYLSPMSQLEADYPDVKFVYMTGHSDGSGESGNLHLRNKQIRDYCIANNKILYDFYDIECYDPDGNYYGNKNVKDNCDYDSNGDGSQDANWAKDWQNSHTEGVDWYNCSSAHSQPLNANRKAYAAWWLWAELAGWNGITTIAKNNSLKTKFDLLQNYPNPFNPTTTIKYTIPTPLNSPFAKGGNTGESVTLKVYNILGKVVTTLVNKQQSAGTYQVIFDAKNLPNGTYFYRLKAGNFSKTKQMILIK